MKKTKKRGRSTTTQSKQTKTAASTAGKKKPRTSKVDDQDTSSSVSRKAKSSTKKDLQSGPVRVFQLTGTREEIAVNESIVLSLGAQVSATGRNFDPDCTHVICSELKRTEKFVAGVAAGKVRILAVNARCGELGRLI